MRKFGNIQTVTCDMCGLSYPFMVNITPDEAVDYWNDNLSLWWLPNNERTMLEAKHRIPDGADIKLVSSIVRERFDRKRGTHDNPNNTVEVMYKVLDCPVCGGSPKVITDQHGMITLACSECGIVHPLSFVNTLDEAIFDWNDEIDLDRFGSARENMDVLNAIRNKIAAGNKPTARGE